MDQQTKSTHWYQKTGWIVVLLIFFWPVGLFLMWKFANWSKVAKWIISGVIAFFAVITAVSMANAAPSIMVNDASFSNEISTDKESYVLRGSTNRGATVTVNGDNVTTDSNGNFSYSLKLAMGDNKVTIVAKEDDKTTEEVYVITRSDKAAATQSSSKSNTSEAEKSTYKVGETATINDRSLTVSSVTRNFQGNEYAGPDSGKEFVIYAVTIKNNGNNEVSYNTYDFKIQDSNGAQTTEAFVVGLENQLNSGSLAAGGTVSGNLGYEVPAGDAGLKLIFKPSFWSNKTVTFSL